MLPNRIGVAMTVAMLLAATRSIVGQSKPQTGCLSYEPAVVTVSGTLSRKTFPGPPNYESIRNGDKRETSWFLDLSVAVCINEDRLEPDLNQAQDGVRRIQLVLDRYQYQQYKKLMGRKVIAKGTLFQEITAHHHVPLLLTVRTMHAAPN